MARPEPQHLNDVRDDGQFIVKAVNSHSVLVAACELALLFHSGTPWDTKKGLEWDNRMVAIFGEEISKTQRPYNEVTTRNLCDAIREAFRKTL